MITIKQITEANQALVDSFSKLIPQLSPNAPLPNEEDLRRIISSENNYLFGAYNHSELIGTLTLVITNIPTGRKAWIEDVIVDTEARGQQIGKKLVEYVINFSKKLDIISLNLTSSPYRIAANNLYKSLGFIQRETNVYRITLEK